VANPNKTPAIVDILAGNKEKLLRYLKDFHNDTSACSQNRWGLRA
jgi:Mo25-like